MMKYKYYDTPDGRDPFKKLFVTSKYAVAVSIFAASSDVALYSHTKGFLQTMNRYAWYTIPLVGMAATFTSVTYMATNLRGKDDKLNSVLGGLSAGLVFGTWQKCGTSGFVGAIALAAAAYVKKMAVEENMRFFPESIQHISGSHRGAIHDFSLIKEGTKGWSTS